MDIDTDNWTGQAGETIRVRAKDDTKVTSVHLFFRNGETIFEEGDAVPSGTDGLLWTYTTQTVIPDTSPSSWRSLPVTSQATSVHRPSSCAKPQPCKL